MVERIKPMDNEFVQFRQRLSDLGVPTDRYTTRELMDLYREELSGRSHIKISDDGEVVRIMKEIAVYVRHYDPEKEIYTVLARSSELRPIDRARQLIISRPSYTADILVNETYQGAFRRTVEIELGIKSPQNVRDIGRFFYNEGQENTPGINTHIYTTDVVFDIPPGLYKSDGYEIEDKDTGKIVRWEWLEEKNQFRG